MTKAKELYLDWLGFEITFEHQFEPNTPYYVGIKKDAIELHLSEHHGDSVPGLKVFIICTEIEESHALLKPYKYYRPSVQDEFYGAKGIIVQEPFCNKLSFTEYSKQV